MIFDTHAHYDDPAFDEDRDELLSSFREKGIGAVTDPASTWESIGEIRSLTKRWPFLFGAYGIHPEEIGGVPGADESGDRMPDRVLETIREACRDSKAVAVGEIGLDYHWNKEDRKRQIEWFEAQIALARQEKLPVIVHSRDAAADTMDIARRTHLGDVGGVMHCYAYSLEMAKEYLDMGLYLGIGGVATFKNARRLREVLSYAPLSQLVLETDCPYLTPEPRRGTRNDSGNLPLVVRAIASIRGISPEEVETATWENAMRMYRIAPGTIPGT
ncbi:MAG: TatD family hydrolase [Bilifractor sp.]|jgi:TatD DNase family protein